jgi:hypothetical protein
VPSSERWHHAETPFIVTSAVNGDDRVGAARDGAADDVALVDAALARGEIDEDEWHRRVAAFIVPAYLAAETPWAQSGKSGDESVWGAARRPIVADRP